MFHGFSWLSERTLSQSKYIGKTFLPGTFEPINQNDPSYTLAGLGESGFTNRGYYSYPVIKNYVIALLKRDYKANKSTIQYITGHSELSMSEPFAVLWAGDIDGDEKPDLIVTNEFNYNAGSSVSLYLSSKGKGGKMVQLVSHFHGVGLLNFNSNHTNVIYLFQATLPFFKVLFELIFFCSLME